MKRRNIRRGAFLLAQAVVLASALGCSGPEAGSNSPDAGNTAAPPTAESSQTAAPPVELQADQEFEKLEQTFDADLGVYAVDTGTGNSLAYNADDRFAYASTFKAFLCAAILKQKSDEQLEDVVSYSADDIISHSPVTSKHIDSGMSVKDLAAATMKYSDNTAANLLLEEIGGPRGLQSFLADNGDDVTHVDRNEPGLNEAVPGDIRDTSTPRMWAKMLKTFALDDGLPADRRDIFTSWLRDNTTGTDLIRAGVPADWSVGDKTGDGAYGTRNDIAVLWPPDDEPIVLAVLSKRDTQGAQHDDALIAAAAETAVKTFADSTKD
ncbi:class A beta-lactamase [Saxibacter everestensis]|uniref:Beta-lactamase n=1 Tax=Saxibacter everestensis TaxID=2909229 RepID=A0ABY8QQR1_9MICO|nr:class A beta-lactamase [Brevibacteriaceae bacterium ZFBP1038]